MGKGGNLVLELIAMHLNAHCGGRFDLRKMISATETYVVPWLGVSCQQRLEQAISSILNLNYRALLQVKQQSGGDPSRLMDLLLDNLTANSLRECIAREE
jgi:hypothetical protein